MGAAAQLPLRLGGAGSGPCVVWRLCPSSSCVFLPPALPFFPTVSLRWQQALFHFICAISSEALLPLLQLWGRVKSQKRLYWERCCVFVCLMEEWCHCAAAHFESTQEYQCSTNSVAGAEVLCSIKCRCLHHPCLQEVWGFGRWFQQFPISPGPPDVCWVTVSLSLLNMKKSRAQSCGAEHLVSYSFRSPETGTWSSNLPTSEASKYW